MNVKNNIYMFIKQIDSVVKNRTHENQNLIQI